VEIVAVIVGFWLVLVSIYLGLVFVAAHRRAQQKKAQTGTIRSAAFSARTGTSTEQPVLGGLFSEVDLLRVQVETLRSEMSALNGGPRAEKARLRRYRSGQYTDLPRTLRRQVREVRNYRHPVSI
jgi:hypothetical protein